MIIDELITLSMREIQAIADGEVPTASELDLGLKRFNSLISSLANDLVVICFQDVQEIVTVIGQTDYPTPVGTYRVRHFDDKRLNVLSSKGYDQYTPNENAERINVYVDYGDFPPVIKFTIAPVENGLTYEYRRDVLANQMELGDVVEFTTNADELLILGLAYKLCASYGVDLQKKASVLGDYNLELSKYKQAQTIRTGTEIVTPNITIV